MNFVGALLAITAFSTFAALTAFIVLESRVDVKACREKKARK